MEIGWKNLDDLHSDALQHFHLTEEQPWMRLVTIASTHTVS